MLIKMFVTTLLHEYEVEFAEPWGQKKKEGDGQGEEGGRFPEPMPTPGMVGYVPNVGVELMVRSRKVVA